MDAAKFVKESVRMCSNYHCDDCPVGDSPCHNDTTSLAEDDKALEKYLAIVEKWSAEHPVKTNSTKLEEIFGHKIGDFVRGYTSGYVSNKAFKDEFICWLGKEYKERKEN
jgi:hypothetical protein